MKRIIVVIAVLLGGCGSGGVEWFPEAQNNEPSTPSSSASINSSEVGTYIASVRTGPGNYTVTTTKGVFSTYTSLGAPYQTTVYLEKHTDPVTGLLIGKILRALKQTILVKDILALVS